MATYEIVDHAVEGNGERHFFRVAVWRGSKTDAPELHAEFLLHPGGPRDPLGPMVQIIETRVRQIAADPSITYDEFHPSELPGFALRPPQHQAEDHVRQSMNGRQGFVPTTNQ